MIMTRKLLVALSLGLSATLAGTAVRAETNPEADLKALQAYFAKQFPSVDFADYANGSYALDPAGRENWLAIEEFPPYEPYVAEGETLFKTPFKNGKTYADCFPNGGIGIKQDYPYFDTVSGQVKTLEQEINECRTKNGEEALPWGKGKVAAISAYMAFTSRGNKVDIKIPNDPRALAAYEAGKKFFYAKRGQLNFSCADCHVYSAGKQLRTEILSPALGQGTHFPVYRSSWGDLGTMHRRYEGCNEQVRAKALEPQSETYRNLEYFHTYMSNGLEVNGPAARK